jgi:tRNA threonylcarbamoyladenosine biosynthesis protein TsaB
VSAGVATAGLDTATAATAAAVLLPGGEAFEARDDPAPDDRPAHAARVLGLLEEALAAAGADWDDVGRLAVGIGPGGFTGLRIGVATARALAQGRGLPLVGVGSLDALAAGAGRAGAPALAAVIDARRGEVFAAAWGAGGPLLAPRAIAPGALAATLPAGARAVGDGAVRFRAELETAGIVVPADGSPAHRVSAVQICRLGADGEPADPNTLEPDYRREPDAKPQAQ